MTSAPEKPAERPCRTLDLGAATAIVVGTVIGAGIYETTPLIAGATSNAFEIVAVFLLGGLGALIGALCYTELATVLDRTGGDFEYLNEAYGSRIAFVFAWMTFWVVQPASVGAIAFVFARHAAALHPLLDPSHFAPLAVVAVAGLTAANVFGLRVGTHTQKLLTALKVLGILILVAAGGAVSRPVTAIDRLPISHPATNWELAFILVMYTYGGWNVIVLVGAEMRDARRDLLRSLLIGLAAITSIYVLVVLAFVHALGHAGLGDSASAASDVADAAFGPLGSDFISVLICITCLANINATILTNSRIFFAFGQRWSTFAWIGRWHGGRNTPVNALIAQGVVTVVLIVVLEAGADSFTRLVVFSAPVFWLFFLLAALSLFVLRRRGHDSADAFRVPMYPLLPMAFCAVCAFMLYASASYAWSTLAREAAAVSALLVAGVVGAFMARQQD